MKKEENLITQLAMEVIRGSLKIKDSYGNYIDKMGNSGYSTFFPDDWDEIRVMDEIKLASENRIGNFISQSPVEVYRGEATNGLVIRIVRKPNGGPIITAYLDYP